MTKFFSRYLLSSAFCLIFFWVFTFFFAIPLFNTPVFAQFCGPGSEPCTDAAGNPICVAIGSCPSGGGGGGACPGGASPGQQCNSECTGPGEETVYNWNYMCICAFSTIRSNSACGGGGGGAGGGGTSGVGTIRPPAGFGIPTTNDPQTFVAGLVRNGIALMIIIAFIVDLIWTILAGYRFILAQGDPKTISAAWSQIYWGLIGLAVIMGSFAIIRMAETFFHVDIITSGLRLPTGFTP